MSEITEKPKGSEKKRKFFYGKNFNSLTHYELLMGKKEITRIGKILTLLLTYILFFQPINARTIYVNNLKGKDYNNGLTKETPLASIGKAFASAKISDAIEIANTGKPYQRPYSGEEAISIYTQNGGTLEKPMIINGNNAVISGLSVIPSDKWKKESESLYSLFFYPMSNMYKYVKKDNWWLDKTQIWWVNGKAAPNCKNIAELKKTPGGFWWNKVEKKVIFHLPEKKKLESLKIEIPSNSGICITHDHVLVKNLKMIFSWNDGFDIAGSPKNVVFKNCTSYNNCGQAFSCHGTGNAYYEDCAAIRCASSGSCDVHWSNSVYKRCLFINNTYEAGVHTTEESIHNYDSCLIVENRPFEQIWQMGHSKLNFHNCVIIGCAEDKSILKLSNGSVSFTNCTIADASSVCTVSPSSLSVLTVENCVLARCKNFFFDIPENFKNRLSMKGNLYIDGPGNYFNKKLYGEKEWPEYLKLKVEENSEWRNFELQGPLKTELPEVIKLKGRYVESAVGAELPKEVWDRYFKLLKQIPTPAGIVEK